MNLGQLIGELRLEAEGIDPGGGQRAPNLAPIAKPVGRVVRNRRQQIEALIAQRGSVGASDLTKALGITPVNAGVMLLSMYKAGQLARSGEKYHYRYTLPGRR